jgi:hypothetical protein
VGESESPTLVGPTVGAVLGATGDLVGFFVVASTVGLEVGF